MDNQKANYKEYVVFHFAAIHEIREDGTLKSYDSFFEHFEFDDKEEALRFVLDQDYPTRLFQFDGKVLRLMQENRRLEQWEEMQEERRKDVIKNTPNLYLLIKEDTLPSGLKGTDFKTAKADIFRANNKKRLAAVDYIASAISARFQIDKTDSFVMKESVSEIEVDLFFDSTKSDDVFFNIESYKEHLKRFDSLEEFKEEVE